MSLQSLLIGLLIAAASVGAVRAEWPYADRAPARGIVHPGTIGPAFPAPPGYPFNADAPLIVQRNSGSGAAVGDYDGDGDLDLYLLAYEGQPNVLLRNDGPAFTDVTGAAGVDDLGLSRVAYFADLDNDGDLDLLVVNENDAAGTHPPSRVFRNDGDGTFTDVSDGSGFAPLGYLRCGAALADYDGDGLLDVFVTAWAHCVDGVAYFSGRNRLYRNLGELRFADVTDAVGLGGQAWNCYSALFEDFDGDRRPDLFVAVDGASDEWFHNTPSGFVRMTQTVGATHAGNGMGVACADYDNDGDLDLYTTNITGPLFGLPQVNCFYRDESTGGLPQFVDRAPALGVQDTFWGWGVVFTDTGNDGDLDLVAVTGFDAFVAYFSSPSHPLFGTPTVFFERVPGGFDRHLGPDADDGRGLVAFDVDRDGDQELLATNVGGHVRLWESEAPAGAWLEVTLRQRRGNRFGIGAVVTARTGATVRTRVVRAGGSFLASGPPEVHFGLGTNAVVDELTVHWTDGTVTRQTDVPVNAFRLVVQPALGDVNADGGVDLVDLLLVLSAWGPCGSPCPFDPDGDGAVGFGDLLIVLEDWGTP